LIGQNGHPGFTGESLSEVHYLTKTAFEQLDEPLNAGTIPRGQ
jgi:hypothetical protein